MYRFVGDPVANMVGRGHLEPRSQLPERSLDRPFLIQYAISWRNSVSDLRISYLPGPPVLRLMLETRCPLTLELSADCRPCSATAAGVVLASTQQIRPERLGWRTWS